MKLMNMSQQIENILLNMKQTISRKTIWLHRSRSFVWPWRDQWVPQVEWWYPDHKSQIPLSSAVWMLTHLGSRMYQKVMTHILPSWLNHGLQRQSLRCNLNQHALPLKLPALVSSQQNASGDSTKWEVYQRVGALRHGPLQCSLDEVNMSLGKALNCWVCFFFVEVPLGCVVFFFCLWIYSWN